MTYIEWIESLGDDCDDISPLLAWTEGHKAGRDAERERKKDLFRQSSNWFEDDQMAQAKWLMEKIDATTE